MILGFFGLPWPKITDYKGFASCGAKQRNSCKAGGGREVLVRSRPWVVAESSGYMDSHRRRLRRSRYSLGNQMLAADFANVSLGNSGWPRTSKSYRDARLCRGLCEGEQSSAVKEMRRGYFLSFFL